MSRYRPKFTKEYTTAEVDALIEKAKNEPAYRNRIGELIEEMFRLSPIVVCASCGERFAQKMTQQIYCGQRCADRIKMRKARTGGGAK